MGTWINGPKDISNQKCRYLWFSKRRDEQTDEWADGWTDGYMDGQTDQQTDGRTDPLIELRYESCKKGLLIEQ